MEGIRIPNTAVKLFPDMGRGVVSRWNFSHHDVGTVIEECELLVLSAVDTLAVNATELQHYTFKFNKDQDCLVMGVGEMFNHSDEPNVGYRLVDYFPTPIEKKVGDNPRKVMEFYLLKPVKHGEQLFIDYNADTKVNTDEYIKSKSMME